MFWLRQFFWWSFFLTVIRFCESGTSLSGIINVDHYLRMESSMILKGRNHLSQEQNRLKLLKTYLKVWGKWRKSYLNQENEYTTIPQNIFHLFKKLVVDLDQTEKIMKENSYESTMIPDDFELPTENHLKQIVLSLVDLQNLYDLKSNEIMNGKLLDIQLNSSLTSDSIHFIGKTCLEYNKHLCAIDWLNLWLSESPDDPDRRKEVFRSLYPTYIFLDQKDQAYTYAIKYMDEDPQDVAAKDAAVDLSSTLGNINTYDMDYLATNQLCRGDNETIPQSVRSSLKCRYKYGHSTFLKLAPLKEEELYNNPKVLLYREVIFDSEIERIKTFMGKYMATARIILETGKDGHTLFEKRVSETGFMHNRSPAFSQLSKRIENVSDLLIDSGEMWQLLSYSPGGHYSLHTDYLPENETSVQLFGHRVASMLIYFNDVIMGGETVFPRIGLSVKPIKGAAIIWYNIHRDGSKNVMVDHSACPVVIGEKWGFTQWFRGRNQISLRRIFDDDSTTS